VVVLFVALLISYPWEVLTVGTLIYLAFLPFGAMSYRKHQRQDEAAAAAAGAGASSTSAPMPPPSIGDDADDERPTRLN